MVAKLPRGETELDARKLNVRLSPSVREAFRTLAVATQKSGHFDSDVHQMLAAFADSAPTTVHDFIIALPLIAEQTAAHVGQTEDKSVSDAWRDLCLQLPQNGFIVSQSLRKTR